MTTDINYWNSKKQELEKRANNKANDFLKSVFNFVEDQKDLGSRIEECDKSIQEEMIKQQKLQSVPMQQKEQKQPKEEPKVKK